MNNQEHLQIQPIARACTPSAIPSEPASRQGGGKLTKEVLGFSPDAAEVADLIEQHLRGGLIPAKDQEAFRRMLSMLRAGEFTGKRAYESLLSAIASGPAAENAVSLLARLFRPDDVIELRAIGPTGGAVSFNGRLARDRERMTAFVRENNGRRNVYFGINPRRADMAGTAAAGKAEDIVSRRYCVLDLDDKDAPTEAGWGKAIEELATLDPTLIVASGNGSHVWLPLEPLAGADLAASVARLPMRWPPSAPTTWRTCPASSAYPAPSTSPRDRNARVPGTRPGWPWHK
jgi:hypothetical protein